jgi:endo-1,4-beta-xylanase
MNKKLLKTAGISAFVCVVLLNACKKDDSSNSNNNQPGGGSTPSTTLITGYTDTTGTLKTLTASLFTNMGFAVTYSPMLNTPAYLATVKANGNMVTFGNELKEGSVVKNDGNYDYTTADALYNICAANSLQVFGHTLVWHSQQNATYLNGLITAAGNPGTGGTPAPNLLATLNGDFEQGTGNAFTNWQTLTGNSSVATYSAVAGNNSVRALQVAVTTPGANAYDVQAIGPQFNVTSGHTINFSVDIKAAAAGGKVRVVVQNANYLQYDITPTTTWATYTFSLVVGEATPIIRLNFPNAGTYIIDNITASDAAQAITDTGASPATSAQAATVIDTEMKRYITTTINHYANKIKAWDVVNEVISDNNGVMRSNANTTVSPANANSVFLYGQYLGTKYDQNNYVLKAFQYAKQADPTVLRFINDYNLDYSKVKTDSLVALVNFINKNGAALVDGIGTQMHISINSNKDNIDYSFQALASTGLKIKISELDISTNTTKASGFTPDATALAAQAAMYKYVMQSYIRNVPVSQRYGVTVWGVADTDSWLNTTASPDVPLLFDKNYAKKSTFAGFKQGLQ